jgi:hypothetical protein
VRPPEMTEHEGCVAIWVEAEMEDRALRQVAVHVVAEERGPEGEGQAPECSDDPQLDRSSAGFALEPTSDAEPSGRQGGEAEIEADHAARSPWRDPDEEPPGGRSLVGQARSGDGHQQRPREPEGSPSPAKVPGPCTSGPARRVGAPGMVLELRHVHACARAAHRVTQSKDRSAVGNRHTLVGRSFGPTEAAPARIRGAAVPASPDPSPRARW